MNDSAAKGKLVRGYGFAAQPLNINQINSGAADVSAAKFALHTRAQARSKTIFSLTKHLITVKKRGLKCKCKTIYSSVEAILKKRGCNKKYVGDNFEVIKVWSEMSFDYS